MTNIYDLHDKPSAHEFIADTDGVLIHTRSGVRVSQFEIEGFTPTGKRHVAKFSADKSGFVGMQLFRLREPQYYARLINSVRVPLTINQKGH